MACLNYDDAGVSVQHLYRGNQHYHELPSLPESTFDLADSQEVQALRGQQRTERGDYRLYFGYPTNIAIPNSWHDAQASSQSLSVEPVLLFPLEREVDSGRMFLDMAHPIINKNVCMRYSNAGANTILNEMLQLSQELGLDDLEEASSDTPDGAEAAAVDIGELAKKLCELRPEWQWREEINPVAPADPGLPIATLAQPGIYNRAVVVMAETSPFTKGLEQELRDLAKLPESKYRDTALGKWITGGAAPQQPSDPEPEKASALLEVLPMNSEQRQAVAAGLTRPLTIITGPPGTGKSQVVTNLLVNAAWAGKRVLFASRNNKAVDVVEDRINSLGSRTALLRVGGTSHQQAKTAEFVLSMLSVTATSDDKAEFKAEKSTHQSLVDEHAGLQAEAQELIELRNRVDQLEQLAEPAREQLPPELFARALAIDISAIQAAVQTLTTKLARWNQPPTGLRAWLKAKLLRRRFRQQQLHNLTAAVQQAAPSLAELELELPLPADAIGERQLFQDAADAVLAQAEQYLSCLPQTAAYGEALKQLQAARSLEEITRQETRLQADIASCSSKLWRLWLRIQPSQLSAAQREKLAKHNALLEMLRDAGDPGADKVTSDMHKRYAAMLKEVFSILPCWAVTSLSARGRIPFEPASYDLVIFDEASQCDIASALPLLYRAKSVVIIGDPQQLPHISSLPERQDQALLHRFGLLDNFPHWAYSYQSLFDLATSKVASGDITQLVDHHRSHADIIKFSNDEFYEQRLRVATRHDKLLRPEGLPHGIHWVDVRGQVSRPGGSGAANLLEAERVEAVLEHLVLTRGYKGTVGVVTPFRAQANEIIKAVNQNQALEAELNRRGFIADTVHKFQGDECDVMVFSPVVAPGIHPGAHNFLVANGNLFNVAITRARAQLFVVGDKEFCGTSDIGYLARFTSYTDTLEQQPNGAATSQQNDYGAQYPERVARDNVVSDWERRFYEAAYAEGIRLIPQYTIEKYVVDFLLVAHGSGDETSGISDRQLAIEIDGEHYHRNWTGELCRRDQLRNQRLIELGYEVKRFWVYEVRDNLAGCLGWLKGWLGVTDT